MLTVSEINIRIKFIQHIFHADLPRNISNIGDSSYTFLK